MAAEVERPVGEDAAFDPGEELAALFGDPVAVAVDVQPAALAGAVVGQDDVGPLAGCQALRVVRVDRDARRPSARAGTIAPEPKTQLARAERDLPAAVGVVGVALAGDGVAALGLGHVDPHREREGRVGVDLERRQFGRRLVVEQQGRQTVGAGLGADLAMKRDRLSLAACDHCGFDVPVEIETEKLGVGAERRVECAVRVAREPVGEGRLDLAESLRQRVLDLADFLAQPVPGVPVVVARHDEGRRRVGDVAVHHVLRRVPEERRERVELTLADRVELVVVAGRAADGQAHEHAADRFGPVLGVDRLVLLDHHAALVRRDVVALEPGGDQLVESRLRQQVAGDLVEREVVERLVPVERLDHPVAVGVHLAVVVDVDAVGVAVAGRVQPVAGSVLAPVRGGEEAVDEPLVGAVSQVAKEGRERARVGRQAGQIEGGAAGQGAAVGLLGRGEFLRFEPRQDEAVQRIARPGLVVDIRRCRPIDRRERPVFVPGRALLDPAGQDLDLLAGKCLLRHLRRHSP